MATPTFIHPGPVFVQSNATANRYITSGELSAEAGLGTVTSIKSGSNITLQPSTITVTGSIGLSPDLTISSATVTGNLLVSGNALFFSPIYQGSTAQRYLVSGEVSVLVSSGITVLNELTTANQSFAVGSTGNDFAISSASQTHTFNIPDAATFARGLVTTGAQTISGAKTFIASVTAGGFLLSAGNITASDWVNLIIQGNNTTSIIRNGAGTWEFQDSSNNPLIFFNNSFRGIAINKNSTAAAALDMTVITATNIGQIVKGAAAQSADLTQWQDSSGNVDISVTAKRTINMASGVGDPAAPGAGYGSLRWEPGTNAGTLKIVAYAGTSTTGTTILDNIGSGS